LKTKPMVQLANYCKITETKTKQAKKNKQVYEYT